MPPKPWPKVRPNALDERIPWGESLVIEHTSVARTMMQAAHMVATAEGDETLPYEARFARLERLHDNIEDLVKNSPTEPDHDQFLVALVKHLAAVSILHNQVERFVMLKHGDRIDELMTARVEELGSSPSRAWPKPPNNQRSRPLPKRVPNRRRDFRMSPPPSE